VANALPDWAILSREGTDVRESLASVANIVLAARSGAAVTDQELRRLARELSLSVGKTPEDTRRAYDKFRKRFDFVKQNLAAGASDTVKAEYEARGGIPIPRGGAKHAPAAAGGFKYLGTE
jgi:phage terminase Nu1 subunit (DNA packaging protein)